MKTNLILHTRVTLAYCFPSGLGQLNIEFQWCTRLSKLELQQYDSTAKFEFWVYNFALHACIARTLFAHSVMFHLNLCHLLKLQFEFLHYFSIINIYILLYRIHWNIWLSESYFMRPYFQVCPQWGNLGYQNTIW